MLTTAFQAMDVEQETCFRSLHRLMSECAAKVVSRQAEAGILILLPELSDQRLHCLIVPHCAIAETE
jgi:hypothetical protein